MLLGIFQVSSITWFFSTNVDRRMSHFWMTLNKNNRPFSTLKKSMNLRQMIYMSKSSDKFHRSFLSVLKTKYYIRRKIWTLPFQECIITVLDMYKIYVFLLIPSGITRKKNSRVEAVQSFLSSPYEILISVLTTILKILLKLKSL
jgi:hypothetical protein